MFLKALTFNSFNFGQGVVVLKDLTFNSFYIWRVGVLERTEF